MAYITSQWSKEDVRKSRRVRPMPVGRVKLTVQQSVQSAPQSAGEPTLEIAGEGGIAQGIHLAPTEIDSLFQSLASLASPDARQSLATRSLCELEEPQFLAFLSNLCRKRMQTMQHRLEPPDPRS